MKFQVLLCALAFSVTACAQTTSGTHAASQGEFAPTQVPPLPAKLEFAGEAVPLGNYDTRESLTREMLTTLYMHSRTMQTLLASERYFAIIEPILKNTEFPTTSNTCAWPKAASIPRPVPVPEPRDFGS